MGNIFLQEMKPVLGNSLITVTGVRITPDMAIARIYVSIMPLGGIEKERVMQGIVENNSDLRRRLGIRVGKQLRIIPELQFFLDESLDEVEKIEQLLKQ